MRLPKAGKGGYCAIAMYKVAGINKPLRGHCSFAAARAVSKCAIRLHNFTG
jgi:hypothetical protein